MEGSTVGYYLRKSVKLGPIRLNLSKSGVGVSAGIPGFRLGVSADGRQYLHLHAGAGGFYVRQNLGRTRMRPAPPQAAPLYSGPTTLYESAPLSTLARAGDSDLVKLLTESHGLPRWDYFVGAIGLVAAGLLLCKNVSAGVVFLALLTAIVIWLARWESRRRTIFLSFGLSDAALAHFAGLVDGFNALASSNHIWSIASSTAIVTRQEWKQNAGASDVVNRRTIRTGAGAPPWVEADIPIPSLVVGALGVHLLPDGLLIHNGSHIAHVPLDQLDIQASHTRFIDRSPPPDSQIVDRTWLHPNRDGGPDRRYATNYEIPVCLYGELSMRTKHGLHLVLQTSHPQAAHTFHQAVERAQQTFTQARLGADDEAFQALRPVIAVNSERLDGIGQTALNDLRRSGESLRNACASYDRALQVIAGQGNTIVHDFLRVLSGAMIVTGIMVSLLLALQHFRG